MPDLFAEQREKYRGAVEPLAVRLRPRSLEEFVGQEHILGQGRLLRRMIDADRIGSLIFCGPPGTGKTTLAEVIARRTNCWFERGHAASMGVKEVRAILADAVARIDAGDRRTILFLDEIHRFARNQQDVLLDHVERGLITLIGTTTENPYFSITSALVSRSAVFRFEPLSEDEIARLIGLAVCDERGFPQLMISVSDEAIAHWARICDGDARRALNALEIAVLSELARRDPDAAPKPREDADRGGSSDRSASSSLRSSDAASQRVNLTLELAEESIQHKALVYDGTGDEHYDVISAFIKSMRGSDPDAAVYWLARMLEAGEDPRFIARRIAILASEDIGNADPQAIQVAAAAWEITERVGVPECQLPLSQAAIYMAMAPKSNASAAAIWSAREAVREGRTIEVPICLRDKNSTASRIEKTSETNDFSKLPPGEPRKYMYPHQTADGYVEQEYLGVDHVFYEPTERGAEATFSKRLAELRLRMKQFRTGNREGR